MIELWCAIPGYEGRYDVSNLGRVYSVKRQKMLRQQLSNTGYLRVRLYDGASKGDLQLVHRLVASVFVLNSEYKSTVSHINGCKTDNRAVNLVWANHNENQKLTF